MRRALPLFSTPHSRNIRYAYLALIVGSVLTVLLALPQPAAAASITVNTTADTVTTDGQCSLREALTNALNNAATYPDCAAGSGDDTITFTVNGTITLLSALPSITGSDALEIIGNGAANTIISGNDQWQIFFVSGGATLTISGVTIANGYGMLGGGLYSQGTLTVTNSIFSDNSAQTGGGLYSQGTLTVTNSSFRGNSTVGDGGGLFNWGPLTITNSTFSDNSADNAGGGLVIGAGTATITNSTFKGNSAGFNGGIRNVGTLNLYNSIIANTISGGDCENQYQINVQNSLIEDGTCGITNGVNGNLTGDPALNVDLTLASTSKAINAGNNALIPSGIATDLTGHERIIDGIVDMGAYESASTALPMVTISPAAFNVNEGANADFTLTRTGDTASMVTVDVTITPGTGTVAADYSLTGGSISGQSGAVTVTIPAGQASVSVNLAAVDDVDAEANNTLTLALVDGATYDLGATTSSTAMIPVNDTVVTNTNDSGDGSLRQALTNANAFASNDTITFTANGTITLLSNLPPILARGTLAITGNGAANTVISGNNQWQIFLTLGTAVTIDGMTFANGQSYFGAGIENGGTLFVTNCTFSANSATHGGGILNWETLTVTDSSFSNNSASSNGGGIQNTGTLTVVNSTFSTNSADTGGGIRNEGTLMLTNSIFDRNSAKSAGGGLQSSGTVTVTNSTFNANSAPSYGSGIDNGGSDTDFTLYNSVVANSIGGFDCSGVYVLVVQNSLIDDGSCGVEGLNGNLTGDPALNGDLTLASTSKAINAGNNALIPGGITTDLAGNARIQQGTVDMGAYESQYTGLSILTVSATDGSGAEAGGDSVTFRITRSIVSPTALTVKYTVATGAGQAENGVDYTPTLSGAAVIAANEAYVDIIVTPVDDAAAEGDETVTLTLVEDAAYTLDAIFSASGTITDDDAAGISVTPANGLVTTEAGGQATFTVRLNSQPSADVTLTLSSDTPTEGTVSPLTLTFTAADWNSPQTVTITGVDDTVADGDVTYQIVTGAAVSLDAAYNGVDAVDVSVSNSDDDAAVISITPYVFHLTEASTPQTYQIIIASDPSAPFTLALTFDPNELTVDGSSSSPVVYTVNRSGVIIVVVDVVENDSLNTDRLTLIQHSITSSGASEYPTTMRLVSVTIDIGDMPPPPPTPTCTAHNFDPGGVVRTSAPDVLSAAINCRVLYQNGASTTWMGYSLYSEANLGAPGLLDLGVLQAVDIFSPAGLTYFDGGAVFCERGMGTLIWMAASGMPRHPEIIGSYTVPEFPGFTCATLFEPGTLILVSENPLDGE